MITSTFNSDHSLAKYSLGRFTGRKRSNRVRLYLNIEVRTEIRKLDERFSKDFGKFETFQMNDPRKINTQR